MAGKVCSVEEFVQNTYDYIICGGGTAGLVLAARLSELPHVVVGVIEAGKDRLEDSNILIPLLFPTLLSNPEFDWMYQTSPQGDTGRVHAMPRGKVLGGSSATNFMAYVRGSISDYDNWAELSNSTWSFLSLLPFFKKHERLEALSPDEDESVFTQDFHGLTGPLHTSFNDWGLPIEKDVIAAFSRITGTKVEPKDAWSGDHIGFYSSLSTIDRTERKGTRSYAGNAYLAPILHRPNLKVLCEAAVSKIILSKNVATGVTLLHGQKEYTVRAQREIIVTCGVIGSPQLLELSGIGDPEVLRAAGVDCVVLNSAVGANFQDHIATTACFELNAGDYSMDSFAMSQAGAEAQQQYSNTQDGPLSCGPRCMGFLPLQSVVGETEIQETIDEIRRTHFKHEFHKEQLEQVMKELKNPNSANVQLILLPGAFNLDEGVGDQSKLFGNTPPGQRDNVSIAVCLQYPASRGSVHITSSDPLKHPKIDPGYLSHPADVRALAGGLDFAIRLGQSLCEDKKLNRQTLPPVNTGTGSAALKEFVTGHCIGEYHGMGTCSITQAVDDRLRVKGVTGIRVADASVFPNNVSGNIQASVYAVAEKAAELIKEDSYRQFVAGRNAKAHL